MTTTIFRATKILTLLITTTAICRGVNADEAQDRRLNGIKNKILATQIEDRANKAVMEDAGIKLGQWHRIGPFRDQPPLINWMDNVASSFNFEFAAEKEAGEDDKVSQLQKAYPAPNFPATPNATRKWVAEPSWIDGYYQELPRGPAPSTGESQFVYRTITVNKEVTVSIDLIIRAPESDRRMGERGMEHWRRSGRYWWSLNGEEQQRWEGRSDMPQPKQITLKAGVNHLLAKLTNNRHSYGFAFAIKGLHPALRHERGFEGLWRPLQSDAAGDLPYHSEQTAKRPLLSDEARYQSALQRMVALKFHPEPLPGVEHAARDSKGRIVPAMEKALERYPTSDAGDRHQDRLTQVQKRVKPLLENLMTSDKPVFEEVLAANAAIDQMWSDSIADLPPLVFLERATYNHDALQFTNSGTRDAQIRTFDPRAKQVKTLYDFRGKDHPGPRPHEINLSWDAETIYVGGGGGVFALASDGSDVKYLQRGQSPCEMPDGRVVFFSDDVGQSPCKGGGPRRLLFVCDKDGENRKVVSANLTIDNTPTVMNDGRIIFARWDYGVNKNVFNRHALWVQNPDGTAMDLFFGNTTIDPRGFYRPRQVPGRPEVMTVFGPHHANVAGLVGLVWNGSGPEAGDGIGFRRLTHDTASVGDRPPNWAFQDPYPLNEQLFLVSFGGRPGNQVGLYLLDRSGNKKCILEADGKYGVHTAQPFVARTRPPVIPDRTKTPNWEGGVDLHARLLSDPNWEQKSTLLLQDVYMGLEPEIKRGQVKYLAVMEQVTQSHPRGGSIGVGTIWYANRCVGLVPVEKDGSAHFEVPALRSLYFHVLDGEGKMLMTQGSDFHTMPGEVRSCVGCHEQRKGIGSPPAGHQPIAASKAPLKPKMPQWGTNGIIEYEAVVQPVLNKYCVSCHEGEKPKGNLNLTGDRTSAYNMSYMELTDRMLVHFTPGTGDTHAQPSNDYDQHSPLSRGTVLSKLTEYIQNPKHCGKKIPFEDQLSIFLWIDSNVPFYSHYRQKSPTVLDGGAQNELKAVWNRRCASCHNEEGRKDTLSGLNSHHVGVHAGGNKPGHWGMARSGMRVRHLNLTNPQNSAALQAPLGVKGGGWGLCKDADGKGVFVDKNDADYKAIHAALKKVVYRDKLPDYVGVKKLLEMERAKEVTTRASSK